MDLDCRAADRDAIDQNANVGLRSGAVRGQFADGPSDERFESCGGYANDRTGFALVALQRRLRDIIAPALGALLRPGWTHSIAAIVEELSGEQSLEGLPCSARPPRSLMVLQALLDSVPQVLRHNRLMLALVDLAFVGDPADVDWVGQDLVDMPPAQRTAAGGPARSIDADRKPKALSIQLLFETHDASRLEIAAEEGAHDLGMVVNDMQCAVLDQVAQRDNAAHPHPLLLRSGDLVSDPLARDLPFELGEGQEHVEGQASHAGRGVE